MQPCPAPFNLADYVLTAGRQTPDKIALAVLGPARAERWSFARLEAAIRGMATGLLREGFAPGDHLLLRLGNTPDFPIAFLGAITADLIPVPTAEGLTEPEVTKITNTVSPKAILAYDGVALPAGFPGPVLTNLSALADNPPADFVRGDPDRMAYLVFTSGSSGTPKAVAHAHRAVWARRMMWRDWYGLTPEDRLLHAGAFNWTFTLGTGLLDPWAIGATALIPKPGTDPATLPLLLKRHDATIFAAAPGVFRKMLSTERPITLPKLRHALSAGEKLPEALRQRWLDATGTTIHEALGMSECSTFISGSPTNPAPDGTLGRPQTGRRIAILNDDGTEAAKGEIGVLAVHRSDPGLCLGYLTDHGTLDLPLTGDWFLTGDRVAQDVTGAIIYHGRRDDLLTTGGFRISPLEIEAVFQHAPGVTDCAATAISVKADTDVLALAFTGDAKEEALRPLADAALARYKQPRLYIRQDTLPRTANGKLNRRALAAALKGTQ
ncbi:MAG: class I adenylate-forming enzyme family protein [Pseudomonadota bacterium]